MKQFCTLLICLCIKIVSFAQFDGAAGSPNSLAVYKNDSRLRAWANSCSSQLGDMDIANLNLGLVSSGVDADACGAAGEGGVLSLGDRGQAILYFNEPLRDDAGIDLVVFENGFSDTFLELAYVEISSNGVDYYRFESISNTDTSAQVGTFGAVNPTQIHNLAGKYRANYGVGFDFSELSGQVNLDLSYIQYVKIISITGSIDPDLGDRDSRGLIINEPYPTAFITGGFDLDAVAGVYPQSYNSISPNNNFYNTNNNFYNTNNNVYPQNQTNIFSVQHDAQNNQIGIFLLEKSILNELLGHKINLLIYNQLGQTIYQEQLLIYTDKTTLNIPALSYGGYYLTLIFNQNIYSFKLL